MKRKAKKKGKNKKATADKLAVALTTITLIEKLINIIEKIIDRLD